jgi:hypothetical protein
MTDWILRDTETGNETICDSRTDAQEQRDRAPQPNSRLEIVPPGETDGGEVEVVEAEPVEPDGNADGSSPTDMSPIDWFGGKDSAFVTKVTHRNGSSWELNKDGTQFIVSELDFDMDRECLVEAHETDFEYAKYEATVTTPDGKSFTAVGDCHIEEDGKEAKDLERMAETRAKKRAVKWASAGGIDAIRRPQEGVDHA